MRRGDRVLLDLQNGPEFVIACFAILRADAVVVPVSPMNLAGELAHYIEDSDAKVAICGEELAERFATLALEHLIVAGGAEWNRALAAGGDPGPSAARAGDLCMMPYTSGSTGRPKGCMHTHATVLHNVIGSALWKHVTPETVALATAPFFHVTGLVHSFGVDSRLGEGSTFWFTSRFIVASPDAPALEGPAFDPQGMLARMGGDRDMVLAILPGALDSIDEELAALRQALEAGDAETSVRSAHTLEGLIETVGGRLAKGSAVKLEQAAREGRWGEAQAGIESLAARIVPLREAAENWLRRS